jgi:hypothetical protein
MAGLLITIITFKLEYAEYGDIGKKNTMTIALLGLSFLNKIK